MDVFGLVSVGMVFISGCVAMFHVIHFISRISNVKKVSSAGCRLPKTAVILSLRGADPFLFETLRSLLLQDYPQFTVKIIIDNPGDPSVAVVRQALQRLGDPENCKVSFVRRFREKCSLKNNALIQAVEDLDPSYEVVAFVDADVVCHPTWLQELVLPLNSPDVGIATGNRWYLANGRCWGSLIRYLWNIYIVFQMLFQQIPWGGSLAVRVKTLKETGALNKWAAAFCEDVMMRDVSKRFQLRVHFVPTLLMLNTEEITLTSLLAWIKRQFLCTRLYVFNWHFIVADNTIFLLPHFLSSAWIVYAVATGEWYHAAPALVSYAAMLSMFFLLIVFVLEPTVQKVLKRQGRKVAKIDTLTAFWIFMGIVPASVVSMWAIVASTFATAVQWRGIEYTIKGPFNVRMVQYHPYQSTEDQNGQSL